MTIYVAEVENMFDLLSAKSKKLIEHERMWARMDANQKYCDFVISQSKEFTALLHDTNIHYEIILGLLFSNKVIAAYSYLDKLRNRTSEKIMLSSNAAVETILRLKVDEAKQNGITVLFHYYVEGVLHIDEMVLCMLLGNAVDIAIEACHRLLRREKKLIEIDIRYKNEKLNIRIVNTSNEVKIVDNRCMANKRDKMLYGYELWKIRKTVIDNGGNVIMQYDRGRFILNIVFLC